MELSQRFSVAQLDEIEPIPCPCGMARRAFGDLNGVASLHMVEISKDSETHYHKEMHEIYLVLEVDVSYTHLPVPTICSVKISVVAVSLKK